MIYKSIENEPWFPRIWMRYVDDIFTVVKKSDICTILKNLNILHESIKFATEMRRMDENGKVSFEIYLLVGT